MADNDEDDDSFGEFTFAPIQTTVNAPSPVPITTGDGDDWGDFNLFQNSTTDHNHKSSPPSPPPPLPHTHAQPKWEKTKGALPLSIFGDDEEQEQENMNDVKQSSFTGNSGFESGNNGRKSNANLGINDLIANLYGERQQQQNFKAVDNGDELNFSAMNSTVSKDPLSKSNSLGCLNTLSAAVGNQGSDDEGGWEFIDAFSDAKKDHKELSEKTGSSMGLQSGSHGHIDLFTSPNNGFFVESHVINSGFDSKLITNYQNGVLADLKVDSKGATNELSSNPIGGSDGFDDTFGEFETAFIEHPSEKKKLSEERFDPLSSHDASHRSIDLFSTSNGVSDGSHMESNGFDFGQITVVENGFASDPFSQIDCKETKDYSDLQLPDVDADDESFGKFEATFLESGSKPQGFEVNTKNYKEPLSLSIFGIEEDPEADNSLNLEYELFKSSTHGKHTRNPSSDLSINDILSDLYSQAQPMNSDGEEDLLQSTSQEYASHVVDDKDKGNDNDNNNDNNNDNDDDFNDDSWEYKDASFQLKKENQNSFKKKLNNCMDFYSNLKDDLCVVASQHLHSLKKAQTTTTLVDEEIKVAALNGETQEALEKLHQKDVISTELHLDDHLERVISLEKYVKTFQLPEYQVLESEYHISRKLLLAESDLPTAIDLINHFMTVLKILTLAPKCEPAEYVSLWLKVISVCSQELNHGTWIWKQSLEKNVHSEILSDKQGRQFIIAIGEIYRAVVILEAAVRFYKPWILLSGADLEGIHGLLEQCHSLWSTSGLEESIPADYLLDCVRHIQNLDEIAIADQILSQEESQCRLSLLSPGVIPGLLTT
ncbi:hypothetical protein E3N88_12033 [Mikania micrantha]|uniref:Synergin gamma C-terminal domain-containing protein n=1 Tax=Mikania micrantha TaxID=192012 RepID=A0A5N6P4C9_9ASTR|nr:hypothetical protein E3N88_12033 [Mikania micrantha]